MTRQTQTHSGIHYLVRETEEYGIAHCLDFDLVATADEGIEEALRRLDILVRCQFQVLNADASKAPQMYWDRFAEAVSYGNRVLDLGHPEIKFIEPEREPQLHIEARVAA